MAVSSVQLLRLMNSKNIRWVVAGSGFVSLACVVAQCDDLFCLWLVSESVADFPRCPVRIGGHIARSFQPDLPTTDHVTHWSGNSAGQGIAKVKFQNCAQSTAAKVVFKECPCVFDVWRRQIPHIYSSTKNSPEYEK